LIGQHEGRGTTENPANKPGFSFQSGYRSGNRHAENAHARCQASRPNPEEETVTQLATEKLVGLPVIARSLPNLRTKGTLNPSTVLRWVVDGSRARSGKIIKLEAQRYGRRWLTSFEALARFSKALTESSLDTESVANNQEAKELAVA
jgi:hypothetical protein